MELGETGEIDFIFPIQFAARAAALPFAPPHELARFHG